jgi:hypothetical protein
MYRPPESEYMVQTDPLVNPKDFKITLLSEKTKAEIYQKHKSDPVNWSIAALAKSYKANPDRIKAVVLLQRQREEFFIKSGLQDNLQEWLNISKRHADLVASPPMQEDGTTPVEKTPLALAAEEFKKSEEEISEILKKIKKHMEAQSDAEQTERDLADLMADFKEMGYDTNFKETSSQERSSFLDNYYPEFLGDDNFEEEKKKLLARIQRETKAKSSKAEEEYESMHNIAIAADSFTTPEHINVMGTISEADSSGKLSRWKFAFRDLSEPIDNRKTYVRSRGGKLRLATPLETMGRSWSQRPKNLDVELYKDKLAKYNDPDQDEAAFVELQQRRLARDKENIAKKAEMKK